MEMVGDEKAATWDGAAEMEMLGDDEEGGMCWMGSERTCEGVTRSLEVGDEMLLR